MHLRALREAKGWTQAELARMSGFQASAIGHWEAGRREPSWANAVKLAKVLGVSLDTLATGADELSADGVQLDAAAAAIVREFGNVVGQNQARTIAYRALIAARLASRHDS